VDIVAESQRPQMTRISSWFSYYGP
jgi:hypothetical protein